MRKLLRVFLIFVFAFVSFLMYKNPVHAAVALDPTFGVNGIVLTPFGPENTAVSQMALQTDGKAILVGPTFNGSNYDWAIARYNTDGSLDSSFGVGGKVTKDFGSNDNLYGVAVQSDGKIVVAGYTQGTCSGSSDCWTVARYNADGSLDSSFGNGGVVVSNFGEGHAYKVIIQSDGKIIVVGTNGTIVIVRYNPDGSIDPGFGEVAINSSLLQNSGPGPSEANGVKIQQDGKIVVSASDGGNGHVYILRLNTDGSLDSTFANGGIFTSFVSFGEAIGGGDIDIQSDGKIVMGGAEYTLPPVFPNNASSIFVGRLNPNGTFDGSFNNGSFVVNPFLGSPYAASVMVLPNGQILLAGKDGVLGSNNNHFALWRYSSDGTLDTTFGNNGELNTIVGSDDNATITGFKLQTDGKLIVAGPAVVGGNVNWGLVRYTGVYDNINHAPVVGIISASINPVLVNNTTTLSASFTDSDTSDTHTAVWDWGDGATSSGTLTESNGSGSVADNHIYTAAGVYEVKLTVTDNNGASGTSVYDYVSVYNPTAQGLFSAGQKYTSPAGALVQNPNASGTVVFGLSYKYQGTVPTGNRQFSMDFNSANFHFNASTITSLVISNGVGTLTGTGTINGSGTYNFLVTGDENTNKIRIRISDSSNNTIYDSLLPFNQPDTAAPSISVVGNVIAH